MRMCLAGLIVLASSVSPFAQEGRTYINRLGLESPEQAVASFIEAYSARDFLAVYFMLTPDAKLEFSEAYSMFDIARYVNLGKSGTIDGSAYSPNAKLPSDHALELYTDPPLMFDDIFFNAHENGQMPFNLQGVAVTETGSGQHGVVEVTAKAVNREFTFETKIVFNGDWRIDRIRWAGSDPDHRPWGIGKSAKKK